MARRRRHDEEADPVLVEEKAAWRARWLLDVLTITPDGGVADDAAADRARRIRESSAPAAERLALAEALLDEVGDRDRGERLVAYLERRRARWKGGVA